MDGCVNLFRGNGRHKHKQRNEYIYEDEDNIWQYNLMSDFEERELEEAGRVASDTKSGMQRRKNAKTCFDKLKHFTILLN